ncbi:MAG: hypothetical protein LBB52_01145 [Desulfovibrio sp.]|jgi:hypothetical protein|nr:hypothetical protein [Desulfovibrio sp.]
MNKTIGIKYCGHCQPFMQMPEFVKNLKEKVPEVKFVQWDNGENFSRLLLLCACPAACVRESVFAGPTTVISCNSIDFVAYETTDALLNATAALLA